MSGTSTPDRRVVAVWATKRRRFFLALGVLIGVQAGILVVWFLRPYVLRPLNPFVAQGLLGILSIVAVAGTFLYVLYDVYCPACGKGLGLTPWARSCPRCATPLQP